MPIPVHHETGDVLFPHLIERCCLCRTPTRYWHQPTDVAVCQACAETRSVEELPTKAEWLAKERALTKRFT